MKKIIRPLWRLLLTVFKRGKEEPLDCDECFMVMEYLADIRSDIEKEKFRKLVRDHVLACPNCFDHYQQRLEKMAMLDQELE